MDFLILTIMIVVKKKTNSMIDVITRIYGVLCLNHGYCTDMCPQNSYCVERCQLSRYYVDMCPPNRSYEDMCPLSWYFVDLCPLSSSVTTKQTNFAGS